MVFDSLSLLVFLSPFVIISSLLISLLTFLCIIKPRTECSATLNCWPAKSRQREKKKKRELHYFLHTFHTISTWAGADCQEMMHHSWMNISGPFKWVLKICRLTMPWWFHNFIAEPKSSLVKERGKQQWVFLIMLRAQGSQISSPVWTHQNKSSSCPDRACDIGSTRQLCGPPWNRNFTSVQLLSSNRGRHLPRTRKKEIKKGRRRRKSLARAVRVSRWNHWTQLKLQREPTGLLRFLSEARRLPVTATRQDGFNSSKECGITTSAEKVLVLLSLWPRVSTAGDRRGLSHLLNIPQGAAKAQITFPGVDH